MSDLVGTGLGVTYGDLVAVRPLDLRVPGGRMVAVTGPSGAGKSSLLWALARALRPAVATVTAATTALLDALPARRQPPRTVPPLRRPEVQARIAARAAGQPR